MEIFFTYFSIKFDNLYLKWNFLRIWLWKSKKWILFYERSPSKIILIENTKLFFFFFGCVYIYNLSNKKRVFIIKKQHMCIYMCVEVVLINILASHLAPLDKNFWLRPWQWRKACRDVKESMQRESGSSRASVWMISYIIK